MFTTFFDLVRTRPFEQVVVPVPRDIQETSRDFLTRMAAVDVMLTKAAEDWTDEYARMDAQQSGIPSSPPIPPPVLHPGHTELKSKTDDAAEVKNIPDYTAGARTKTDDDAEPNIPLLASHSHLFPCMISSLGTGCNMSKVKE